MSWLQLALGIVSLLTWLTRTLAANKSFSEGQQQAVADALRRASDEIAAAIAAGRLAEEKAKQGEFDPELFRDKP